MVINEVFDSWERKKTDHDIHLIFPKRYEAAARSLVRRNKNSPSVKMRSFWQRSGRAIYRYGWCCHCTNEIVATDNGDATDMTSFASHSRKAFSGLCLVVVRTRVGEKGKIVISATSEGLKGANLL